MSEPSRPETRWAIVRLFLGQAQMIGAVMSFILLIQLGINEWSLGAVVLTCLCTTVSVLLFGGRRSNPPSNSDSKSER